MAKYAIVSPADAVLEIRTYDTPPPVAVTASSVKPRLVPVVTNDVVVDAATEVREGPTYVVEAAQVTQTYTKRAKTPAELDAAKEAVIPPETSVLIRALFNHENRIRQLESRPAVTAAQFRTALKAML